MPKKKKDSPEILKLREKLDKPRAEFERWYTRLVRSMTRLH